MAPATIAQLKRTIPQWMLQVDFEEEGKRLNFPYTTKRLVLEMRAMLSGNYQCHVLSIDKKTGIMNLVKWTPYLDYDKKEIEERIREMKLIWKNESKENECKPKSTIANKLKVLRQSIGL